MATVDLPNSTFIHTRTFPVSVERLFAAWVDPSQISTWWGPMGFSNTFDTFEPYAGGLWRFVMHGPDGKDYPNESRFLEVVAKERIVLDHVCAPFFQITATFREGETAGTSRLDWHMKMADAATFAALQSFIPGANEENLDRLETLLCEAP